MTSRFKLCRTILCGFLLCIFSAPVGAGIEISGGAGNGYEIEFRRLGSQAMDALLPLASLIEYQYHIDVFRLAKALKGVSIDFTCEDLLVNQKNVSAANSPPSLHIFVQEAHWLRLREEDKMQLVLHELLGLEYPGLDSRPGHEYELSKALNRRVFDFEIENVVLTVARLHMWQKDSVMVQRERTRHLGEWRPNEYEDEGEILEVYVQTFENSSPEAVRIYQVFLDQTGSIRKLEMSGGEGPIGP